MCRWLLIILPLMVYILSSTAQVNSASQVAATGQGSPAALTAQNTQKVQAGAVQHASANSGEDHKIHFHLGTVSIGGGYFSDPFFPYGPYPFDNYGPYPCSAFFVPDYSVSGAWIPYSRGGWSPYPLDLNYRRQRGEVRLAAEPATAEVYIDGGLAGTASHLKRMWLEPGAYDLSVSSPGMETFHQRLYVLSGRSLNIEAKLSQN